MEFYACDPTIENYWRGIILFGKNSASYKFALAKSLLELADSTTDLVTLDELAKPFSKYICQHLRISDKQTTSPNSNFLNKCSEFNNGHCSEDELLAVTNKLGFVNVIDAFHVVNNDSLEQRFFIDERREYNGIRLTENMLSLARSSADLMEETEARWRLVETAWSLRLSRNLIQVQTDELGQELFTNSKNRRVSVTSSRSALNGYQKGSCFYCFGAINISETEGCDVDHFFPHILKELELPLNLDGVWNLVLACTQCNRGENGKFARLPHITLLERLHKRNEYLITSHHPLRETLIAQTGRTHRSRSDFLQTCYNAASILGAPWQPEPKGSNAF